MTMLWLKAFHIIFMTAWFAALFYLPRLFVYHASLKPDQAQQAELFCVMEKRLYWGIMTPCAILTLLLGTGVMHAMRFSFAKPPAWLALKLILVVLLVFYHGYCGVCMKRFRSKTNTHSATFYRLYNEITLCILVPIVLLVVLKPPF